MKTTSDRIDELTAERDQLARDKAELVAAMDTLRQWDCGLSAIADEMCRYAAAALAKHGGAK